MKPSYDDKLIEKRNKEEHKKRIFELFAKVEGFKETREEYQIMLEILEDIKRSSISDIGEKRNDRSIHGLAYVIRGYENLIADPRAPYEKFRFREELDYLYGLINKELKKPRSLARDKNSFFRTNGNLYAKKKILMDLRTILGQESLKQFCTRYGIPLRVFEEVNTKAWFLFCAFFLIIMSLAVVISFL